MVAVDIWHHHWLSLIAGHSELRKLRRVVIICWPLIKVPLVHKGCIRRDGVRVNVGGAAILHEATHSALKHIVLLL